MLVPGPSIDREASQAVKRIETQLRMEGKLEKSDIAEGTAILFLPLIIGVIGLVAWTLKSLDIDGPGMVMLAVPITIGLLYLGFSLTHRK